MRPASSILPARQRRRKWLTDIRAEVELPQARFERLVTARIRSPFLSTAASSSSSSSCSSERTGISLFSVSEIDIPRRPPAARRRVRNQRPTTSSTYSPKSPTPSLPSRVPSRAVSAGSGLSQGARAAARLAEKERLAQEYLERLVRKLTSVTGVGDPRYVIASEFIDTSFPHIAEDFGQRCWYPQNLRLTPKLTAVVRSEVLRRLDVEHLPVLQRMALLGLDSTQPSVSETRLELLLRWLDHLPEDEGEFADSTSDARPENDSPASADAPTDGREDDVKSPDETGNGDAFPIGDRPKESLPGIAEVSEASPDPAGDSRST